MIRRRIRCLSILVGVAILMSPLAAQAAPEPAQPLYVFIYRPGPAWKAGLPMDRQDMRPHGAYIARLDREGRIVAAGGFQDDAAGGAAIVRAASAEEARALLAADPAVASGLFLADVRPWRPRFGDPARAAPAAPRATPQP